MKQAMACTTRYFFKTASAYESSLAKIFPTLIKQKLKCTLRIEQVMAEAPLESLCRSNSNGVFDRRWAARRHVAMVQALAACNSLALLQQPLPEQGSLLQGNEKVSPGSEPVLHFVGDPLEVELFTSTGKKASRGNPSQKHAQSHVVANSRPTTPRA